MTVEADALQQLWRDILRSASIEQVLANMAALDTIASADRSGLTTGELRVRAFRRLQELTVDDPGEGQRLISEYVIPFCALPTPGNESDVVISRHLGRECLRDWLDQYPEDVRAGVRDRVLDTLRSHLELADPSGACATLATIGFRRADIVDALWDLSDRSDNQDDAVAAIVAIGTRPQDRERLLGTLHQRLREGPNDLLVFALTRLADPESVGPIRDALRRAGHEQRPSPLRSLLLRTLAEIADRWDADAALQDRIWEVVDEVISADAAAFANDVYLGSDLAPRCDCPHVVSSLLTRLTRDHGDDERAIRARWLLYLRLADCVRPRQLEAWANSAERFADALDVVRSDACRDSNAPGRDPTLEFHAKENAWDIAPYFGSERIFEWYEAAAAPDREKSPFARAHVSERLACFRLSPLPELARNLIVGAYDAKGDDFELSPRLAAVKVGRSAASREAFDALFHFGLTADGKVLLPSVEALADVAVLLALRHDPRVVSQLVKAAGSATPSRQRTAAAGVLERLAAARLLPDADAGWLWDAVEDTTREEYERSVLIGALGFLSRDAITPDMVRYLRQCAHQDNWLGWRSLEALARLGHLAEDEDLLSERLGLAMRDARWRWEPSKVRTEWAAFDLGLLYVHAPTIFTTAVADAIAGADWQSMAELVPFLVGQHGQPDRPHVPESITNALLERARSRHSISSAELGLFDLLATLAPEVLAGERWEKRWDDWLSNSRVALARALGKVPSVARETSAGADFLLHLLAEDSSFAVRRSAHRALAGRSPQRLNDLCALWREQDAVYRRIYAAEAATWLPDDTNDFTLSYEVLSDDPEREVREVAERSRRDRRQRRWAAMYFDRLGRSGGDGNAQQLAKWRYGQAITKIGDDWLVEQLQELAASERQPHRGYWLGRLAERTDKRWRDTVRAWPDAALATGSVMERGEAVVTLPDHRTVPVRASLWARPRTLPELGDIWGATASVSTLDALSSFFQHGGTPGRFIITLADGRRGEAGVESVSSSGTVTFRGISRYPRHPLAL